MSMLTAPGTNCDSTRRDGFQVESSRHQPARLPVAVAVDRPAPENVQQPRMTEHILWTGQTVAVSMVFKWRVPAHQCGYQRPDTVNTISCATGADKPATTYPRRPA